MLEVGHDVADGRCGRRLVELGVLTALLVAAVLAPG
jgi:hypothetical protein